VPNFKLRGVPEPLCLRTLLSLNICWPLNFPDLCVPYSQFSGFYHRLNSLAEGPHVNLHQNYREEFQNHSVKRIIIDRNHTLI